jgi:ribosome-associated heat shock protein Hsp15
MDRLRIDKWLWAARFYKTRSLAAEEIGKGRVAVNGQEAKPAREVKVGDTVLLRREGVPRTVVVKGLSSMRGPAPVAQLLYEETPQSLAERERLAQLRHDAPEPAHSIEHGRPTKRGRRDLEQERERGWGDRWSASLNEDD